MNRTCIVVLLAALLTPLTIHAQEANSELCKAAKRGEVEEVRKLLDGGANANGQADCVPLIEAAYWGRAEVVNALLE
ncbi:MAG TPA: ankyrin repeat domain-containing protein [Blastocatellia bacterium]|nr:ankyrin repeat domain-containing protein [Blastocatellia bacterium]